MNRSKILALIACISLAFGCDRRIECATADDCRPEIGGDHYCEQHECVRDSDGSHCRYFMPDGGGVVTCGNSGCQDQGDCTSSETIVTTCINNQCIGEYK